MADLLVTQQTHPENIPDDVMQKHSLGLKQQQPGLEIDFVAWVDQIFTRVKDEVPQAKIRRRRKQVRARHFYRGEQHLIWKKYTNTYDVRDIDEERPTKARKYLVNNQVRPQIRDLAKQFALSEPRLSVTPVTDDFDMELAARLGGKSVEYYERTLVTEDFRQREAKLDLLSGNVFWKTSWVSGDNTITSKGYADQQINPGVDQWHCEHCQAQGPMSSLPQGQQTQPDEIQQAVYPDAIPGVSCPHCGNGPVVNDSLSSFTAPMPEDQEETVGQPEIELVDPLEIDLHDRARNVQQSPYLLRTRLCLHEILADAFRYAKIESGDGYSLQSQFVRELELSTGAKGSTSDSFFYTGSQSAYEGLVELKELWLEPAMYRRLKLRDKLSVNGIDYPPGTMLIDKFPKGLYLCKAGDLLVDLDNECKDDHWVMISYDISPDTVWADGAADDLVQIQMWINEVYTLILDNIAHNAVTTNIFNQWQLDPDNFTGDPKYAVCLNDTADPSLPISEAVHQLKGSELPEQVFNAMGEAKADMREMSGARLEMSGNIDPQNRTATGMAIAQRAQVEGLSPALKLRASGQIERAYQLLCLIKENLAAIDPPIASQYLMKIAGKYGADMIEAFMACDPRQDFIISYVPGSEMPRTKDEIMMDTQAFLTFGGLPMGLLNPAWPKSVRDWGVEYFQPDLDLDEAQPDRIIAQERIKDLLKKFQGMLMVNPQLAQGPPPTPAGQNGQPLVDAMGQPIQSQQQQEYNQDMMQLDQSVPVLVNVDDHPVYIAEYKTWLKTDQGKRAPQPVRDILIEKIKMHLTAQQELGAEAAVRAMPIAAATSGVQNEIGNAQNPQPAPSQLGQAHQQETKPPNVG